MKARCWSRGDPEPTEPGLLLRPAELDWRARWSRDPADGRWVCSCEACATTYDRDGTWPARWPWADLVAVDGPLVEVAP